MIQNATNRADQLTDLSNMVIERFKEGMANLDLLRQHQLDVQRTLHFSAARKRWLWAIRRVIRQLAVSRMKVQLQRIAAKAAFSPSGVNGGGNSVNNPKSQAKLVRAPTQIQDRVSGSTDSASNIVQLSSSRSGKASGVASIGVNGAVLSKQQRRVSRGSLGSAYAKPSLGALSEGAASTDLGAGDGAGALDGSKSSSMLPRLPTMRRTPSLDGYVDSKTRSTMIMSGLPSGQPLVSGKHKLSTVGENLPRDAIALLRQQSSGVDFSASAEDDQDDIQAYGDGEGSGEVQSGSQVPSVNANLTSGFIMSPSVDSINASMSNVENSMAVVVGVVGTHAKTKPIRRARSTNIQLPELVSNGGNK